MAAQAYHYLPFLAIEDFSRSFAGGWFFLRLLPYYCRIPFSNNGRIFLKKEV